MKAQINADREAKRQQMADVKDNLDTMTHGVAVAQKLDGDAKKSFVEDLSKKLDESSPGTGATFKAMAQQPSLLSTFSQYMPYLPAPMQLMAKNDPAAFMKFVGTEGGMKEIETAHQQYLLKSSTDKARLTMASVQAHPAALVAAGVPQEKIAAFLKSPSASTFGAINDALPASSPSKMSADEMQAANAHKPFYQALGMLSPEDEAAIKVKQGEATDTTFMKEAAARYGKDTPEYKDALSAHVARMDAPARTTINTPGDKYTNVFESGGKRYGINKAGVQVEIPTAPGANVVPTSDKQKAALDHANALGDRIDSLVAQLRADPSVAGGAGVVSRGYEAVAGTLDPNRAPTGAHLFESQLTDLKTELHNEKFGKRFSKAAMDRMDEILQGAKIGQPAPVAIASLLAAKNHLLNSVGGGSADSQGAGTSAGPKAGDKQQSKSGRGMHFDGANWVYD